MDLLFLLVLLSALLCALVAGLVLGFAIVVMPGIRTLGDLDYLKTFKAIDAVIQNNQPVFMIVWLGSALAVLASALFGIWQLEGLNLALLILACLIYIAGVQLPTVTINIPLNNRLQALDLDAVSDGELREVVELFETRWVRWNLIRTIIATLTALMLMTLLVRF